VVLPYFHRAFYGFPTTHVPNDRHNKDTQKNQILTQKTRKILANLLTLIEIMKADKLTIN
jgi:hypothetical protein